MALALGSAVSGLLAYLAFALITRGLGSDAAAPVSVLWTHWAFAGAAFTFPLQHWITRTVTAHGQRAVQRAVPRISVVVCAAALCLGALAWVARHDLFHRSDPWFPAMVALITVGSALIGVVRGGLGAQARFAAVAWSLVAENGLRCVLIAGLLLADVTSAVAHGLSLVAGQLVVVLWPSALRYSHAMTSSVTEAARPFAFLAGAGAAQLISQTVLTGGPVVLALSQGSTREVTALFAALALFRAPYMLALGSVPQLTMRATRLVLAGEGSDIRALVRGLVATTALAVALGGVLGGWLGPTLLRLVFGEAVEVSSRHAVLLAIGCTLAVSNLLVMVVALAQDRPAGVVRAWVLAVVAAAVGFLALSAEPPFTATVLSFLIAETTAFLALLLLGLDRGDEDR